MADAARSAPAGGRRPRWHPAAPPVALLVAGAAGAAYLWGTNPHEPGHVLPQCPFRAVTGLLCPACGGTRMAYDLMHGHFAAAWLDNRALLLATPFVLVLWGRWTIEGLRGRAWSPRFAPWVQALILLTAVAWTVARNLVR
ncbi:DUF2752 domain-containing protein [Streptomyces sp. NPDC046924]|uniref:DUF2752 domain-containing protein n=1 Tax=Streptomyces sp. NPDC046924 TaxID=3155136 RepID=UPI0033CE5166